MRIDPGIDINGWEGAGFSSLRCRCLCESKERLLTLGWLVCREAQLEHALLLHFAGQHDDALQELKLYKKGIKGDQSDQIDVVLARLAYLVYEKTTW